MNNYTYYSYEEYGRGYIGSRGCKCSVEEDVEYFGSFSDKTFKPTQKIILETFETRVEAYEAELLLHNFFKVDINSHFANRCKLTSSGFTVPKRFSDEEIKQKLKKRKKKYAEKNSDSIKLYQKNWNEENKERKKEYAKLYYEKNKENFKQKSKEQWERRENKEEFSKNYYKKYKESGYYNNYFFM